MLNEFVRTGASSGIRHSIGLAPISRNFKRRCEIGHDGQARISVVGAHAADWANKLDGYVLGS